MTVRRLVLAGAALALCLTACAEDTKDNPAAKPLNRDNARHKQFLKTVAKGEADVIFVGDSITEGWEGAGQKAWADAFAPLKAVNLGIGGDQTGHVLWRITEGKELDPIKPKAAVLMIGTNNMGAHTAEQIAGGVKAVVDGLHKQKPDMKILVLGVFPRAAKADEPLRKKVNDTNALVAKLVADNKQVTFKDINAKFLDKDGTLDRKIMPDLVHLSEDGYRIWADAIKDDVAKMLK